MVTFGTFKVMQFSLNAVKGCLKIGQICTKYIKGAVGIVKNVTRFIAVGIKKTIQFGFKTLNAIIRSPFKIINGIRSFLSKPLVINLFKFLKTDAGAMILGTLAAFYKVFIHDAIKEKFKWIKDFLKNTFSFDKNSLEVYNFKEFAKTLFYGTNIDDMIMKYESVREIYRRKAKLGKHEVNNPHFFI